jgi:hypothetical protein
MNFLSYLFNSIALNILHHDSYLTLNCYNLNTIVSHLFKDSNLFGENL